MITRKINAINIPGHKERTKDLKIVDYLDPEYVYITLTNHNYVDCKETVCAGDYVKMGQIIAYRDDWAELPIHASVSGEVIGIEKHWHALGKPVQAVVIKNDKKYIKDESIKPVKNPDKLTREEIIEIVKDKGIVGLGGSGFPTYIKYKTKAPIQTVLLNGVECEPYITADYRNMFKNTEEIFKGLKYIMRATDAKEGVIAIKKGKPKLLKLLQEEAKKHDNVRVELVPDVYPAGWEKYIINYLFKKDYKNLPSEVGIVVNNTSTAYAIYNAIENGMPLITKLATVAGEALKENKNFLVRTGTKFSELLEEVGGYTDDFDKGVLIAGGPMTGNTLRFEDFIISKRVNAVMVKHYNQNELDEISELCMRCGKCATVCPTFLTPVLIKDAYEVKNKEALIKLNASACIQCGACSYVCPSRVEITDFVKKGKALALK